MGGASSAQFDGWSTRTGLDASNTNLVCDLGAGCADTNYCNGHGYCEANACLCDTGYWGDKCDAQERGFHCENGMQFVPYILHDFLRTGAAWAGVEMRVQGPHSRPTFKQSEEKYQSVPIEEISSDGAGGLMYSGVSASDTPVIRTSMCSGSTSPAGVCLAITAADAITASYVTISATNSAGGSSLSVTTTTDGSLLSSYSLDIIPPKVVSGQSAMAGWEMCGRIGGAPARFELLVYKPSDALAANSSSSSSGGSNKPIHRNPNDHFGYEHAFETSAPLPWYNSNDTYCALQCADKSQPLDVDLWLADPYADLTPTPSPTPAPSSTSSQSETYALPNKYIDVGSDPLGAAGELMGQFGYSVLDTRTGLELGAGSFMMTRAVTAVLVQYLRALYGEVGPQRHLDLARVRALFPLKQTQSVCLTAALVAAAKQAALSSAALGMCLC